MGVAHDLTTIGGISSVTMSYWVENLYLSFAVSIKSTYEYEWCRVTCWNGLGELIQKYVFIVIQYIDFQKQSMRYALKVLGKSLKTVLDEVHFIVIHYTNTVPPTPKLPGKLFVPPGYSFAPLLGRTTSKTFPSCRHISNSLSVCLFLDSAL